MADPLTRDDLGRRLTDARWRQTGDTTWMTSPKSQQSPAFGDQTLKVSVPEAGFPRIELFLHGSDDLTARLAVRLDGDDPWRQAVDALIAVGAIPAGHSVPYGHGWTAACRAAGDRLNQMADAAEPDVSDGEPDLVEGDTAEAQVLRAAATAVRHMAARVAAETLPPPTADKYGVWTLPEAPGPEVMVLREALHGGRVRYVRDPRRPEFWRPHVRRSDGDEVRGAWAQWPEVLAAGPLVDATHEHKAGGCRG